MKRDARLLRGLRAERRLTQAKLARVAGISSQSRYWQIENGEGAEPSAAERAAIALALNVKESEIAWPDTLKAHAS